MIQNRKQSKCSFLFSLIVFIYIVTLMSSTLSTNSFAFSGIPVVVSGNIVQMGTVEINSSSWDSGFDFNAAESKPFIRSVIISAPDTYTCTIKISQLLGPLIDLSEFYWQLVYIGHSNLASPWVQHSISSPDLAGVITPYLDVPISKEQAFIPNVPMAVFTIMPINKIGTLEAMFMISYKPKTARASSYSVQIDFNVTP